MNQHIILGFYLRVLAILGVCLSVHLSILVSRPGTIARPGKIETSRFHHVIAWSL